MTDSAETMREAIARIIDPRAFDNPKYPASDDTMWREAARDTALTRAAAILAMQAERQGDNTIQRDKIYRAAERSNTRFGQWIPERWVNIFVEELNK